MFVIRIRGRRHLAEARARLDLSKLVLGKGQRMRVVVR